MGVSFLGTGEQDSLGVLNGFRKFSELYIKQLVSEGKWFTVCHKINEKQVDIMRLQGKGDSTLGKMLSDTYTESSYRTGVYKYMLKNYLCYIETPTISYRSGSGGKQSFDKILATSNTGVIASWLGVSEDDLQDRYKARVFGIDFDDGDDELPYVKLSESKTGTRSVICPRSNIDVSKRGTRVIPLFMLKEGVDALYERFNKDIIKVSFLKDNGQVRDIFTTTNFNTIREIYGNCTFSDYSVQQSYEGDFLENKALFRGYIRVPEIGGSRYDTPTRSINYARIIEINYDEEPDLTFIDIDLSTVIGSFQDLVQNHMKDIEEIINTIEAFGIDGGCWSGVGLKDGQPMYPSKNIQYLLDWATVRKAILSTVFERDLCLFMLANPQWFGEFTGEPKMSVVGVSGDDDDDIPMLL